MARNEEMERRLQNWARWRCGAGMGGLGYSSANLTGMPSGDRGRESVIPTDSCEAEVTQQGVMRLESELRRTVEVYYLSAHGTARRAQLLCITEAGMYRRVERAHRALEAWLVERERVAREQRQRVEGLQRRATQ
jgi:hypothetical protein